MSILDDRKANKLNKEYKEGNLENRTLAAATSERKMREALTKLEKYGDVISETGTTHSSLLERVEKESSGLYLDLSEAEKQKIHAREKANELNEKMMYDLGYSYIYASTQYRYRQANVKSSDQVTGYSGWISSSGSVSLNEKSSSYDYVSTDTEYREYIEGKWVKVVKKGQKQKALSLEKKVQRKGTLFFQIKDGNQKEGGLKKSACIWYNVLSCVVLMLTLVFLLFTVVVSGSRRMLTPDGEFLYKLMPEFVFFIYKNQKIGYIAFALTFLIKIVMAIINSKGIAPYEATNYTKRKFRFGDMVSIVFGISIFLCIAHFFHLSQESDSSGEIIYFLTFLLEGLIRIPFFLFVFGCLIFSIRVIQANTRYEDIALESEKRMEMVRSGEYEECLKAYNELRTLTVALPFSDIISYDVLMEKIR